MRQAVQDGMADAWEASEELKTRIEMSDVTSGDVVGTREYHQNNYLYRMAAAVLGIYGNSREEAIYPTYWVDAEGESLNGASRR
jgi:hypothetical protein